VATEEQIASDVGAFSHNPLKHALYCYSWNEGVLEGMDGPRIWQRGVLKTIGTHLTDPARRHQPIRIAVASGHGIGKSALIAMIANWALDTCEDTRVVITANTEPQIRTKTWPELVKWRNLSITRDWFKSTATGLISAVPGHDKTWRADAVTWSAHNTEAFAGLHNQGKRIVIIYDEASGIDDKVWEVTQGALTDENTEIIWIAFGNPTKNTGRFRECFGRQRNLWYRQQIDSREVEGTNKVYLDELVASYGEDSDIVKVRVRGMFPSASSMQLIPSAIVTAARSRVVEPLSTDPVIFGLDCARFGDDHSTLAIRCGRDARSRPWKRWHHLDAMTLAGDVAQLAQEHRPDMIFVDAGNIGAAVIDRLRQLDVQNVVEVWFGGTGRDIILPGDIRFRTANKRTEMWIRMRHWLEGSAIPNDDTLDADLTGVEYGYGKDETTLLLEKKEHMKARGLASPDDGDALACTFAETVMPRALPSYLDPSRYRHRSEERDYYAELRER
jgi:hypothetical protein